MAVVAIVDPEIAENTVPATTATTARRPGTCAISRSMPSITLTARPVWKSTSPIRTKSGIGVSEKLITELTLLRASCVSPGSPPSQSHAPSRLMTRKANATGRPTKSSTVEPASSSQAAPTQPITIGLSCGTHRIVARPNLRLPEPAHAKDEFDREQREADRQRRQEPPLGHDQRLDREGGALLALPCRRRAVDDEPKARDQAEHVGEPFARVGGALRQRAQDDVDADVAAFAQQPRRGEQGDRVEQQLGDLVAPGDAARQAGDGDVPRQDVGADDRDHRQQGDAGDEREELDCLAEAGLERRRAAALHFAVSVFSLF